VLTLNGGDDVDLAADELRVQLRDDVDEETRSLLREVLGDTCCCKSDVDFALFSAIPDIDRYREFPDATRFIDPTEDDRFILESRDSKLVSVAHALW
jgi:hypothetical protein